MLIEVQGVGHTYGQGSLARTVLSDLNLVLAESRIGVIGHNGSGKSTFVRMLNGLIQPTEGAVTVNGLSTVKQAKEVRKQVGFLFTDPDNQIIMPTVGEDVAFGIRKLKLPKEEVRERVMALLTPFGLADHYEHPAHLLSGGQKQLLALASVLITEPNILVMDEPTTLLDLRNASMIGRRIAELNQNVILATHHLHLLEDFDRVLVFDNGRIVADDDPAPAIEYYRELMAC